MKTILLNDVDVEVLEILPKIFHIKLNASNWDLAMHFMRFQEYFSSKNPRLKGNSFLLYELFDWYGKQNGYNVFSYPRENHVYAIPGFVFKEVFENLFSQKLMFDQTNPERSVWMLMQFIASNFQNINGSVKIKDIDWNFFIIATKNDLPIELNEEKHPLCLAKQFIKIS